MAGNTIRQDIKQDNGRIDDPHVGQVVGRYKSSRRGKQTIALIIACDAGDSGCIDPIEYFKSPVLIGCGMSFHVKQVDFQDPKDSADLTGLLREYAQFERCDRPELSQISRVLAEFPTAFSVLAYADRSRIEAVGLINCFYGFSTFEMRPLVNIHDVIVTGRFRGQGVAAAMLREVERIARMRDCCRLTLEVYEDNTPARRAYEKYGFIRDPSHPDVDVHFLRKPL